MSKPTVTYKAWIEIEAQVYWPEEGKEHYAELEFSAALSESENVEHVLRDIANALRSTPGTNDGYLVDVEDWIKNAEVIHQRVLHNARVISNA